MVTLLICGVGMGMEKSIQGLHDLASEIVVIGDQFKDKKEGSVHFINAYPRDFEKVENAIKIHSIQKPSGIISLGYDNPIVIARLLEKFSLPGITVKTAQNCFYKEKRISILQNAGLHTPKFKIVNSVNEGMAFLKNVSFPVVAKPNDKTSSIGVLKIDSLYNAKNLLQEVIDQSSNNVILIEEFLRGSEHTFEGIIAEGEIFFSGISDRNYSQKEIYYPYFFENGDTLPSKLSPNMQQSIKNEIIKSILALGLDNTPFHTDILVLENKHICILEVTCRLAGSRFGTELVPLSTGVNVLKNVVRLALYQKIEKQELVSIYDKPVCVVSRYKACFPGTIEYIGNIEDAKSQAPNIYDIKWESNLEVGKTLSAYKSGKDMLANVIAFGNTYDEAERAADNTLNNLPIFIKKI